MEEFMTNIRLPKEAIDELNNYHMTEEEYEFWKALFWNDRDAFFRKLEECPDGKLKTLFLYVRFGMEMKQQFLDEGVSEEIYYDTFYDLTIWSVWNKKHYGSYGMAEARWYERLFERKVFRLGRLEFEKIVLDEDLTYSGGVLKKGEKVIGVHIPEGGPLDAKECDKSFCQAEKFFPEEYRVYTCFSWLTSPAVCDVLEEDSNIVRFQKRFEVVKVTDEFPLAERRVYGMVREDKSEYPEDTRLRRNLKQYLLDGKTFGIGLGVMKRSV